MSVVTKCDLISYNKFIKLQPFINVFVDVSSQTTPSLSTTS